MISSTMYNFINDIYLCHTHTHNTQKTQKLGLKEFYEEVSVRAILNI